MLQTVEMGPEDARTSIVWLHGLGADGHDFAPIVPLLGMSRVRFVFPHAELRPVTINGGMRMRAWYDILTLEHVSSRESEPDIRASARQIEALLQRELDRGAKKLLLLGFSQGGAMALHVGVRTAKRLEGIGVLSGYLVLGDRLEAEQSLINHDTPMLFCHGRYDEVVPLPRGAAAYQTLAGQRPRVDWHEYDMGHEVNAPELRDLRQWIQDLGGE